MIFSDMRAFRLDRPTEVHKYAIARRCYRNPGVSHVGVLDSFRLDSKGRHRHRRLLGSGRLLRAGFRRGRRRRRAGSARRLEDDGDPPPSSNRRAGASTLTRPTSPTPKRCQRLVAPRWLEFGRVDVLINNNANVGTAVPATRETAGSSVRSSTSRLNGSCWVAPGLRAGDAAGRLDHQHCQHSRPHHRRAAASRLQRPPRRA